jgi:hypothetical protein
MSNYSEKNDNYPDNIHDFDDHPGSPFYIEPEDDEDEDDEGEEEDRLKDEPGQR